MQRLLDPACEGSPLHACTRPLGSSVSPLRVKRIKAVNPWSHLRFDGEPGDKSYRIDCNNEPDVVLSTLKTLVRLWGGERATDDTCTTKALRNADEGMGPAPWSHNPLICDCLVVD